MIRCCYHNPAAGHGQTNQVTHERSRVLQVSDGLNRDYVANSGKSTSLGIQIYRTELPARRESSYYYTFQRIGQIVHATSPSASLRRILHQGARRLSTPRSFKATNHAIDSLGACTAAKPCTILRFQRIRTSSDIHAVATWNSSHIRAIRLKNPRQAITIKINGRISRVCT